MKTSYLCLFVTLLALPSLIWAEEFVNDSKKLALKDLGQWALKADEVRDGNQTVVKFVVADENLNAEFKVFKLGGFDVDLPEFQEGVLNGLSKAGMTIVTSYEGTWGGRKTFKVYAIQETGGTTIHVMSYSCFSGSNFVTLSVADDNPGVEGHPAVQHLIKNASFPE